MPHPDTAAASLDAFVAPLIDGGWLAGVVIAIESPARTLVRGYGRVHDGGGGGAPDAATVFEIGSVTKTFTALALADAVARHELSLETPAAALLPPGASLPVVDGRAIELVDLATHRSGLPRMPPAFGPADPGNPYADFHDAELLTALRDTTPGAAPGARYEYSNYAYGLLGWLLARHARVSYAQLVAERVTRPLGMTDTTVALTASQRARFAQGHDVDGDPAPPWDFDATAGAGALRSTAADMLRFVRAQIAPPAPLADAIRATHAPRAETASPPGYVALGWHLTPDRRTLWHNGGTGGYRAYVACDTADRTGVVVLASTASPLIDQVGDAVMRSLRGEPLPPLALPPVVALDDAQLERYVGAFELAPGVRMVITHAPGVLRARLGDQPAFRIHPTSATDFRYRVVDASVTFELDAAGRAVALTLHQNGRDLRAARVADGAP